MLVGTIKEIWRYPVKSMAGEELSEASVGRLGIPGDRGWALRDETTKEITSGGRLPLLMQCAATYVDEPGTHASNGSVLHANISLPEGTRITTSDPNLNSILSALVGKEVTLWPLEPVRNISTPPKILAVKCPPGTYFDAYPIHVLTSASLKTMGQLNPEAIWDTRRFRPNFFVETNPEIEGLVEAGWSGRTLKLGSSVELKCEVPAERCRMATHAQKDLPKDPSVLRTIAKNAGLNLGVYANVLNTGQVFAGDRVELV